MFFWGKLLRYFEIDSYLTSVQIKPYNQNTCILASTRAGARPASTETDFAPAYWK